MRTILRQALRACLFATLCTLLAGVVSASAAPLLKGPLAAEGWNMSVFVETPIHDMCVGSKNIIGVRSNLVWQTSYGSVPTPVKGSKIAGGHVWSQIGDAIPNAWSFNVMLRPNYQEVTYTAPGKPGEESILVFSEYYDGETLYHDETRLEFRVIHCKYSIEFDGTRTVSGTQQVSQVNVVQKIHGKGQVKVEAELYPPGDALVSGSGTTDYNEEPSSGATGGWGSSSETTPRQGKGTFHVLGSPSSAKGLKLTITVDPVEASAGRGQITVGGKSGSGPIKSSVVDMSSPKLQDAPFIGDGQTYTFLAPLPPIGGLTIEIDYNVTLKPED